MQRQAVPLLSAEAPIVGTGIEARIARDSGVCVVAREAGHVIYADADEVRVDEGDFVRTYKLTTFRRSNQGTVIHQRVRVHSRRKFGEGADYRGRPVRG